MQRVKDHLVRERGMPAPKAEAVAIQSARKMCSDPDGSNWKGVQDVNAGSRAEACAAVAEWDRRKTQPEPEPDVPEPVSEEPWDGSPSRFTDAEWTRSCALDLGPELTSIKERYSLPIREPDGTLNRSAVHAAASLLARITAASVAVIAAAARLLLAAFRALRDDPPESLRRLARRSERRTGEAEMSELEQRTIDVDVNDLDVRGRTLHGFAAVYGVLSHDLGGFKEKIAPGAFADVLSADVRCLVNHDPNQVLGRTRSGTLRLHDEERGLRFECDLPNSPLGDNVREAVKRGDVDGASFRFKCADEDWDGEVRTVTKVGELHDVTVATYGAYPDASIELRTRPIIETEEEPEVKTEARTTQGGGLTVEDRSAAPENQDIEVRVLDAILSVRKGESRSLTTTSAGPLTPPELSVYVFDRMRPASVLLRAGVRVITTDRDSIQWPQIVSDVTPGWVSEAQAITPSDPTFATLTATPRKLAALVQFSNEVIDDSHPDIVDLIRRHVSKILALRLDLAAFEGTGVAPEIRGVRATPGIQEIVAGANGAALTLDMVADALGLLEAANVPGPHVVVLPPRNWSAIRKLKDTTNAPLLTEFPSDDAPPRIFGARVLVSGQLSLAETQGTSNLTNSVYVFAPSELVLVRRQDAELELDRSRLFNSDQSELRGKLRADLLIPNPAAIVRIRGAL